MHGVERIQSGSGATAASTTPAVQRSPSATGQEHGLRSTSTRAGLELGPGIHDQCLDANTESMHWSDGGRSGGTSSQGARNTGGFGPGGIECLLVTNGALVSAEPRLLQADLTDHDRGVGWAAVRLVHLACCLQAAVTLPAGRGIENDRRFCHEMADPRRLIRAGAGWTLLCAGIALKGRTCGARILATGARDGSRGRAALRSSIHLAVFAGWQ